MRVAGYSKDELRRAAIELFTACACEVCAHRVANFENIWQMLLLCNVGPQPSTPEEVKAVQVASELVAYLEEPESERRF